MVSRLAAFVIWAAVAASTVFWAMRLWTQPIAPPAHAVVVSMAGGFNGELGRVLGEDEVLAEPGVAAAPQADARFRLIGVVAPRGAAASAEGVALIATDGKPPKAYRVGRPVDGELVLQSVHARGASLGPRGQPAQVDLQLPALPPPATGALPAVQGAPVPRMPMPRPPQLPPQAMPLPQAPMPPDGDDADTQPDPANRPVPMPPGGALRPPT